MANINLLQEDNKKKTEQLNNFKTKLKKYKEKNYILKECLNKEIHWRRKLHNQMMDMKGWIWVFCWLWPCLSSEKEFVDKDLKLSEED